MKWLQRLFGVDGQGRPTMPNSRRQLALSGLICLAIWPGTGLVLLLTGALDSRGLTVVVSPWLIVTAIGVYFLGMALFSTKERAQFQQKLKKRHSKKGQE